MTTNTEFKLKQRVSLAVNPTIKGIIIAITQFADGSVEYKVTYFDEGVREFHFQACELINDDELY